VAAAVGKETLLGSARHCSGAETICGQILHQRPTTGDLQLVAVRPSFSVVAASLLELLSLAW